MKPFQILLAVTVLLCLLPATGAEPDKRWQKRWVYIPSNLYVNENLTKLEDLLKRARQAGDNGVLFADYKTFTWWQLDTPDRWEKNAKARRQLTRKLDLELVVCCLPFGRANALLWHDPDLASGMPIRNAPVRVEGNQLVPVATAAIRHGSFEEHRGDTAAGFAFQDDPGNGSFIDSQVVKEGKASLRFENVGMVNPHGHGRICQKVTVKPWQQYRLRVWMKTEHLTTDDIKVMALAGNRTLQAQFPAVAEGKGFRSVSKTRDLTTDWVEQNVTFNSLDNQEVLVYLGLWGGKTGKVWWGGK